MLDETTAPSEDGVRRIIACLVLGGMMNWLDLELPVERAPAAA